MAQLTSPRRFVHLHLHSQYSLLDGGNRLDRLIKRIKDLHMDAVALTDHGNLHGAVEFYRAAQAAGVKPILGIEAYVAPDLGGQPSDRTRREFTGISDGGFHLVLLVENDAGWQNLLKLSSDSFLQGFYYRPRMDKTTLAQWSDGLIAINGHLGSSIAHWLVQFEQTKDPAHYRRAVEEAKWHAQTFGTNDNGEPCFYIELQSHEERLQEQINPHLVRLARELDLPLVCDNDAHFLTAEDWDAHDTLCCISMGKLKSEQNRLHYPHDLYVKSPQQMCERFVDELGLSEAVENTVRIAERCNVKLDFTANHAPVVQPVIGERVASLGADIAAFASEHPTGSNDWYKDFCSEIRVEPFRGERRPAKLHTACDEALRLLTEAGAIWRYGADGITDEIRRRIDRELAILADKRISAYFLIVWDFVNEAKRRDIPAMARGSGVGTMVGYCLGLSNACPVDYGLLFERFTDPDRSEYPDIDIDMCQDGRAQVIDYVRQKYGHVAQIITFGTLKARAAIRDVGRVLNVPLPEVDKVCKLVGNALNMTIDRALKQEPQLRKLYDESAPIREVIDTARRLEGMARHAGVHAAGVIVATEPLDHIVPLYKPPATNGAGDAEQIVTQWDGPTCEAVGLLKMDFLGLRTLSVIELARKLIRSTLDDETIRRTVARDGSRVSGVGDVEGEEAAPTPDIHDPSAPDDPLDLERLRCDDPRVFALFARAETAGVFQFESGGMRNALLGIKPDCLEDLIAANALFRPGPMELIPNFTHRKHGRETVPKVHPIVDELTAATNGIMVYQEQVMQVANQLGGIPLRQAYSLIKAISKKKHKVINANRAQFVENAQQNGCTKQQAEQLFELILKFAGYGFNKSHSTGYAITAYHTAYLKTYFPVQYMAALLTYESVSTDKVNEYIEECRRVLKPDGQRGVAVKPPDINLSYIGFTVAYDESEPEPGQRGTHHGHIRFGLSAVKGVGEKAIRAILDEREAHGPFRGLYNFCERVPLGSVNRATIEALIKCGAFDSVHGRERRSAMTAALDAAIQAGQRAAADRASGQMNFFGGADAFGGAEEKDRGSGVSGDRTTEAALPRAEPWPTRKELEYEKEALGFYVSSHPLDEHAGVVRRFSTCTAADARQLRADTRIVVGGMLTRVRRTFTRAKREPMAMLTIEDRFGSIEAVAFPRVYDLSSAMLEPDAIVFLDGKVDRRREEPNLIVERVIPIEHAELELTRTVRIIVEDTTDAGQGTVFNGELLDLREVLRQASNRVEKRSQSAEVVLELRQAGRVVSLRLPLRVRVDEHLLGGVRGVLNRARGGSARCELIGPQHIDLAHGHAHLIHHDADFTGEKLAITSHAQDAEVCASVERY